jgi:hypothetical protein
MFVVVETPAIFKHPDIDKYTHVALISTDAEDCIIAGDFVEESLINKRLLGVVGTTQTLGQHYVKLNAKGNSLNVWLLDWNFINIEDQREVVLHFKVDK